MDIVQGERCDSPSQKHSSPAHEPAPSACISDIVIRSLSNTISMMYQRILVCFTFYKAIKGVFEPLVRNEAEFRKDGRIGMRPIAPRTSITIVCSADNEWCKDVRWRIQLVVGSKCKEGLLRFGVEDSNRGRRFRRVLDAVVCGAGPQRWPSPLGHPLVVALGIFLQPEGEVEVLGAFFDEEKVLFEVLEAKRREVLAI